MLHSALLDLSLVTPLSFFFPEIHKQKSLLTRDLYDTTPFAISHLSDPDSPLSLISLLNIPIPNSISIPISISTVILIYFITHLSNHNTTPTHIDTENHSIMSPSPLINSNNSDDAKSPLSTTSIDEQQQQQSQQQQQQQEQQEQQGEQRGNKESNTSDSIVNSNAVSESPRAEAENFYPEDVSSKRTSIAETTINANINNNNNNNNTTKNKHNNDNILGIDRFQSKAMTKEEVIKQLQDLIEDEFSFEIILKQRELFTIETEISKCEAHILALRNHYAIKPTDRLMNEPSELTETYAKLLTQFDDIRKELDEAKRAEEQRQSMPSFSSSFTFAGGNSNPYLLHDDFNNSNFTHSANDASYRTRSQTSSLRPAKYAQQCIYKRSDGIYVKITCVNCQRSNFSSCQGFLNHARIAHGKEYTSQDNAALTCGEVLPDEEQEYDGMESLKIMRLEGVDPNKNLTRNQILGGKSVYSNPNGFISAKSSISTNESPAPSAAMANENSASSTLSAPVGTTTTTTTTTGTDKTTPSTKSVSFEKRKSTSGGVGVSLTPPVRRTDHLKARVEAMKNSTENGSNDDFQELVTDVTTKVDKSHLFEGEEESTDSLISELEKSINKKEAPGRNTSSTRGLASSTSKNIQIDENVIIDDNATPATTTNNEANKETDEFREKVKKTQNILMEAKKLNLNVDEYLKMALQKRKASESIDDESVDMPVVNKRQKGSNRGGRRKSRSNMGIRRSSNSIPIQKKIDADIVEENGT